MNKKGITPIISIIVLLLITISLAGAAYFFMTNYVNTLTGQAITLSGVCQGGHIARVSVANMGSATINLDPVNDNPDVINCMGPGDISGDETKCGDITVVSLDGHSMDGNWSATSIATQTGTNPESAVFRDYNCNGFCKYAFTRAGELTPVTTTVQC
jgi:flagellin-like protein